MLGTLYLETVTGGGTRTRALLPLKLVEYFGIDVKLSPPDSVYPSQFSAPKVPMMQWADGQIQEESIPIVLALVETVENGGGLLGDGSLETRSLILSWLVKFNYDISSSLAPVRLMHTGRIPKSKEKYDESWANTNKWGDFLEKYFTAHDYLVKDQLTIADLYGVTFFYRSFEDNLDAAWRAKHPNLLKWWTTVSSHKVFNGYYSTDKFAETFEHFL